MRNWLTFGGRDSRDFGVYISGQGTFSAPEKAYTFYAIPGRSGDLIGNERRLENIQVSYECFIYSNFSQNIADFRTYLLSLDGYQELTDTYHPDEFRLACFAGPLEPEVTKKNDAGRFTLTFNCKPQRYLYSGKTSYSWSTMGNQTVTGETVTVTNVLALDQTVLTSYFDRQYPLGTSMDNGGFNKISLYVNGNKEREASFPETYPIGEAEADWIAGTAKKISDRWIIKSSPAYKSKWKRASSTSFYLETSAGYSQITFTLLKENYSSFFNGAPTFNSGTQRLIFTTLGSYASVNDFTTALEGVFGLGNGTENGICNVHLKLSSPVTVSVTPYSFPASGSATYSGTPGGAHSTVTVEYTQHDGMSNPTPFPSEPLVRVYGVGSFVMDGVTVTVTTCSTYTDIDCELMDCYEGSTNRNNAVSFSTYDFPKLQPGENAITLNTGITLIEITPRWWRV